MTDEEILQKAIEKTKYEPIALYGYGWDVIFSHDFAKLLWGKTDVCTACGENAEDNYDDGVCKNCCEMAGWDSNGPGDMSEESAWKYHLKHMVVEEDPIKYLEKFL